MIKENNTNTKVQTHNTFENEEIFIKVKNKIIMDDINSGNDSELIASLSGDIGLILANDFDDLPTHTMNFKQNIRKVITRALHTIKAKKEKIAFIDLSVYSLLFIKKFNKENSNTESLVADKLIEDFGKNKTGRIVKIEYADAIFIFFPNDKIKKNLKDSGFYDF